MFSYPPYGHPKLELEVEVERRGQQHVQDQDQFNENRGYRQQQRLDEDNYYEHRIRRKNKNHKQENDNNLFCCFSWEFLGKILLLLVLSLELCSVFLPLQDSCNYILNSYQNISLYEVGDINNSKNNLSSWRTSISTWSICNKDFLYFDDEGGVAEVNIYFVNGLIDQHVLIGNSYSLILSIPLGLKNLSNYYCSAFLSRDDEEKLKSAKQILSTVKSKSQFLYATENEIYYDADVLNGLEKKDEQDYILEGNNSSLCMSLSKVYLYCILSFLLGITNVVSLYLLSHGKIGNYREYTKYQGYVQSTTHNNVYNRTVQRTTLAASSLSCSSHFPALLFLFFVIFTILLQGAVGFGVCLQYLFYRKYLETFYSKKYQGTQFDINFHLSYGWLIFFISSCALSLFSIYKLMITLCSLHYSRIEADSKVWIQHKICYGIKNSFIKLFRSIERLFCCERYQGRHFNTNTSEVNVTRENSSNQCRKPSREIELNSN